MKLVSTSVAKGQWVQVADAVALNDLNQHWMTIGAKNVPALVERHDLYARCPDLAPGVHQVSVRGIGVGRLTVR
jgi:hypothetical protein